MYVFLHICIHRSIYFLGVHGRNSKRRKMLEMDSAEEISGTDEESSEGKQNDLMTDQRREK